MKKFLSVILLAISASLVAISIKLINSDTASADYIDNQIATETINDIFSSQYYPRERMLPSEPKAYVQTPNGTDVEVYIKEELSSEKIVAYNKYGSDLVPTATILSNSSQKYNCHSYAWYMQSTANPYWMNYPNQYYEDGSYYEVSTPHINDRICYFDGWGKNLHSGIVVEVSVGVSNQVCGNSNLVTVESKWGSCGLYRHKGDECPYTAPYGGEAVTVKFYHRHVYTFQYTGKDNDDNHIAYCACGDSITEAHTYTDHYISYNAEQHYGCCACDKQYKEAEAHEWEQYVPLLSIDGDKFAEAQAIEPNAAGGGIGTFIQCKKCYFRKKLGDDEIIILPGNGIKKPEEEEG